MMVSSVQGYSHDGMLWKPLTHSGVQDKHNDVVRDYLLLIQFELLFLPGLSHITQNPFF